MVASPRPSTTFAYTASDVPPSFITTSLKRSSPSFPCEADHRQAGCSYDGCLKGTVALWSMPQTCQSCNSLLSQLWRALDGNCRRDLRPWTAEEIPECKWLGMGSVVGLEWFAESDSFPTCEKPVPKGPQRPERQGKRQISRAGSPWWCAQPQSPFVSNSPYTVATTAPPWSVEKPAEQPSVNQELIQAVRKAFPDPAGLPPELKDILDKTESSEMKKITTDLHKSTAALGRARKQLQELQEAKSQHRAKWVQHLNASLDAWQKQTEAFDKQQVQYSTLIQQATIELHAARNSIQQLNAKAAQDRNLESLLEEAPAEHLDAAIVDAEEKKLREKMQDVLSKAAKAALPAAEVVDLVETPSPVTMRQRSVEPAGGQDTAMQSGTK